MMNTPWCKRKGEINNEKTFSQNLRHGFGWLDEYFVAGLQIKTVFSVHELMVINLLGCLLGEKWN